MWGDEDPMRPRELGIPLAVSFMFVVVIVLLMVFG